MPALSTPCPWPKGDLKAHCLLKNVQFNGHFHPSASSTSSLPLLLLFSLSFPFPFVLFWRKLPAKVTFTTFSLSQLTNLFRRSSILQIRKVHASMDTGYYECHAINPVSMSIGRVRVIVTRLVKPSPVGSAPPSKDLPTEGTGTTTTATTAIPFSGPTAESREKLPWAPSDWQVRSCPIADYCLNGGQCSFYESVGEYVCQ